MALLPVLASGALAVPAAGDPSTRFVTHGTSARGRLMICGNLLPDSEFIIQSWVSTDGTDSAWGGRLIINGYSTDERANTPRFPRPTPRFRADSPDRMERRFAMQQAAADSVRRRRSQAASLRRPFTDLDKMRLLARIYGAHPELVDSARVLGADRMSVWWKGDADPEEMRVPGRDNPEPAAGEVERSVASSILSALQHGCLVMVRTGGAVTEIVQAPRIDGTLKRVAAMKAGRLKPSESGIGDPVLARMAVSPAKPLEALRVEGAGHEAR